MDLENDYIKFVLSSDVLNDDFINEPYTPLLKKINNFKYVNADNNYIYEIIEIENLIYSNLILVYFKITPFIYIGY